MIALIIAGLVVAFLIFGLPRINRRSSVTGSLFGDDDARSAAAMRRDALAAASRGDYSVAIVEMFRAVARGLAERTIVTTTPGTTARDFAGRTGRVFPALADRLASAAGSFDAVRYLGRAGTREQFEEIASLEVDLVASKPPLEVVP